MKKVIKSLLIFIFILFVSCAKSDLHDLPSAAGQYLGGKSVIGIRVLENEIWYLSTRPCDTCSAPLKSSVKPLLFQLSRQQGSTFLFDEDFSFSLPVVDQKGNLYTAKSDRILIVNDIRNYEPVVFTRDYTINQFVFDKNNHIWMIGSKGIASWDGARITFYNSLNTNLLKSDIAHGIAVDQTGTVWITLDFNHGLLKITDGKWEIIPYSSIPGMTDNSYLTNPLIDKDNSVWFTNSNPTSSTNVLCFDGKSWTTEFPEISKTGELFADSRGDIWRLNYGTAASKTSLKFLNNGAWINFDISDIKSQILSLNADYQHVFIGTTTGLEVRRR